MRVRILKPVVANKRPQPVGAEIDIDAGAAKILILTGKAEIIKRTESRSPSQAKKTTRRRKPKTIED